VVDQIETQIEVSLHGEVDRFNATTS